MAVYKNPQIESADDIVIAERLRITKAIEEIDLNTPAQLNALGMKLIVLDIINPRKSEAEK
jgi:hypothetical protein